jgi:hypothetical protein
VISALMDEEGEKRRQALSRSWHQEKCDVVSMAVCTSHPWQTVDKSQTDTFIYCDLSLNVGEQTPLVSPEEKKNSFGGPGWWWATHTPLPFFSWLNVPVCVFGLICFP